MIEDVSGRVNRRAAAVNSYRLARVVVHYGTTLTGICVLSDVWGDPMSLRILEREALLEKVVRGKNVYWGVESRVSQNTQIDVRTDIRAGVHCEIALNAGVGLSCGLDLCTDKPKDTYISRADVCAE